MPSLGFAHHRLIAESSYRQSLTDDRRALFDRYRLADEGRKLLYWQYQHAVHGRPLRFGVSAS
jgi:hypothetical protein